eukprot:1143327-Pelagomonas_calceolata.AAC.1
MEIYSEISTKFQHKSLHCSDLQPAATNKMPAGIGHKIHGNTAYSSDPPFEARNLYRNVPRKLLEHGRLMETCTQIIPCNPVRMFAPFNLPEQPLVDTVLKQGQIIV